MKNDIDKIHASVADSVLELVDIGKIQLSPSASAEDYAKHFADMVTGRMIETDDGWDFRDENLETVASLGSSTRVQVLRDTATEVVSAYESFVPTEGIVHFPIESEWDFLSENLLWDVIEGNEGEGKRAKVVLIRAGWSKNMNYYSPSILEQLVPLIKKQPKIFVDHTNNPGMEQWAATIETVTFVRDGINSRIEAIISFDGAPKGEIFREAVIHQPGEVGLSINTMAEVSQGEREGKQGRIVEKWVLYKSTDFVHGPSAGGGIKAVFASINKESIQNEELEDSILLLIAESLHSLGDEFERTKERNSFFLLLDLLTWLIVETSRTADATPAEKKKHVSQLVGEFSDKLGTIDLNRAFPPFGEINSESGQRQESVVIKEAEMEISALTAAALESANPALVKEIMEKAIASSEDVQRLAKLEKDFKESERVLKEVTDKLEASVVSLKEATDSLETLKLEKEKIDSKLSVYEDEKQKKEKEALVDKAISDSKYPGGTETFPEYFRNQLLEEEDEEKIKTTIEELANGMLSDTAKVEDNGNTSESSAKSSEDKSKDSVISNDKSAANSLNMV